MRAGPAPNLRLGSQSTGLRARIRARGNRSPSHHEGATEIEPRLLAAAAASLADQKKGGDIRVYDVSDQIKVADYFVVVTGTSRPHVKAIYNEIHVRLKAAGETHGRAEGADLGWWILLDYVDVVVHIQQPEAREYYALDHLYGECEELDWETVDLPELPEPRGATGATAAE